MNLEALAAAMAEPDPSSLGAGERLRERFGADDAAWALTQAALRRRGLMKFGRASEMLFTSDGVEQATRDSVRRWRAERFREAGVGEVWDLGCGIGADAMAFAEAGIRVHAVDADEATARVAAFNLALVGGAAASVGLAEDVAVPSTGAVFLDPARRGAHGRTWRVADFTPPWSLVLDHLTSERFTCVKLGPGLPKELIPDGVRATWVSDGGDVVEVSLWNRLSPGVGAVLLGVAEEPVTVWRPAGEAAVELPVAPLGRFVHEPDGAVIRAGVIGEALAGADAWLLDGQVAYVSTDSPLDSPSMTSFEVLDVLDYDVRALRAWVRANRVGTLEIKKRAIDVDPAELRRRLKPSGRASATVILARTNDGTRAIVARRLR